MFFLCKYLWIIYDKAKDIWMVDERSDIFIVSFIYRVPIRKKVRRRR